MEEEALVVVELPEAGKLIPMHNFPQINLTLFCLLFSTAILAQLPQQGNLEQQVHDRAGLLEKEAVKTLNKRLHHYYMQYGSQIMVLTLEELPASYSETRHLAGDLVQNWKIGRKGYNDGIFLLLIKDKKEARIEVGTGLEYKLRPDWLKNMLADSLSPAFQEGGYLSGLNASITAIQEKLDVKIPYGPGSRWRLVIPFQLLLLIISFAIIAFKGDYPQATFTIVILLSSVSFLVLNVQLIGEFVLQYLRYYFLILGLLDIGILSFILYRFLREYSSYVNTGAIRLRLLIAPAIFLIISSYFINYYEGQYDLSARFYLTSSILGMQLSLLFLYLQILGLEAYFEYKENLQKIPMEVLKKEFKQSSLDKVLDSLKRNAYLTPFFIYLLHAKNAYISRILSLQSSILDRILEYRNDLELIRYENKLKKEDTFLQEHQDFLSAKIKEDLKEIPADGSLSSATKKQLQDQLLYWSILFKEKKWQEKERSYLEIYQAILKNLEEWPEMAKRYQNAGELLQKGKQWKEDFIQNWGNGDLALLEKFERDLLKKLANNLQKSEERTDLEIQYYYDLLIESKLLTNPIFERFSRSALQFEIDQAYNQILSYHGKTDRPEAIANIRQLLARVEKILNNPVETFKIDHDYLCKTAMPKVEELDWIVFYENYKSTSVDAYKNELMPRYKALKKRSFPPKETAQFYLNYVYPLFEKPNSVLESNFYERYILPISRLRNKKNPFITNSYSSSSYADFSGWTNFITILAKVGGKFGGGGASGKW